MSSVQDKIILARLQGEREILIHRLEGCDDAYRHFASASEQRRDDMVRYKAICSALNAYYVGGDSIQIRKVYAGN